MYLFPSWNFYVFILFLWPWTAILRIIAHKLVCGPRSQISFSSFINKQPPFNYYWIDCLAMSFFMQLWLNNSFSFPVYFFFFSALTISIYTDIQHMLISRFVSLYAVPVGIYLSYAGYLPISPFESAVSAAAAYLFLFSINKIFYLIKKHDGLGQGDLELFAFIASFAGLLGCWFTILFSSMLGTLAGCSYMLWSRKTISMLPFGPFLAVGAMLFVLFEQWILASIV
ncbi:MAG: prepilin peptidase [Candidatus Babeliales bacterium]|jgi:leader peptidase (prepilin peptidase)/N-methyltransferase